MNRPTSEVTFRHGPPSANQFMLAPLTNQQSHVDGTMSDDEYGFLVARAAGGFGIVMTCASHVSAGGQGFAGQLGCFSDDHVAGLTRLASGLHDHGALAIVQLHHAGRRSPAELTGTAPVAPSDDASTNARALKTNEVDQLIEDFIMAAKRCERAGFDGVELHAAHDYILCEFLNESLNARTDRFGGSAHKRSQIVFDIISGIRSTCRADFNVSVRLSPERFGMTTRDMVTFYDRLVGTDAVDFIDLSMWDVSKTCADPEFAEQNLLDVFTQRPRGDTRLAVAGKLYHGHEIRRALDAGVDIVALGRAAITNHNFPQLFASSPDASMRDLPVSAAQLREESLGDAFIEYMSGWAGFVEPAVVS